MLWKERKFVFCEIAIKYCSSSPNLGSAWSMANICSRIELGLHLDWSAWNCLRSVGRFQWDSNPYETNTFLFRHRSCNQTVWATLCLQCETGWYTTVLAESWTTEFFKLKISSRKLQSGDENPNQTSTSAGKPSQFQCEPVCSFYHLSYF